jgi:hypothetical protein
MDVPDLQIPGLLHLSNPAGSELSGISGASYYSKKLLWISARGRDIWLWWTHLHVRNYEWKRLRLIAAIGLFVKISYTAYIADPLNPGYATVRKEKNLRFLCSCKWHQVVTIEFRLPVSCNKYNLLHAEIVYVRACVSPLLVLWDVNLGTPIPRIICGFFSVTIWPYQEQPGFCSGHLCKAVVNNLCLFYRHV